MYMGNFLSLLYCLTYYCWCVGKLLTFACLFYNHLEPYFGHFLLSSHVLCVGNIAVLTVEDCIFQKWLQ